MIEDLQSIGDELESAAALDLQRNNVVGLRHVRGEHTDNAQEANVLTEESADISAITPFRRQRSRRVIAIAALATIGIGGVAAATAINLSNDEVSKGLPGGSAIFEGTNPSCTSSDSVVFDCVLASAPTEETLSDYTGTLELFVDDSLHIAGGCRGITSDGLQWTCFAGQRSVDEGIMSQDLLGQYEPSPGHG